MLVIKILSQLTTIAFITLSLFSCKPKSASQIENNTKIYIDTLVDQKEVFDTVFNIRLSRDSLNRFLEKPFDLYCFKKKVGGTNSGGGRNEDYYF